VFFLHHSYRQHSLPLVENFLLISSLSVTTVTPQYEHTPIHPRTLINGHGSE
jgi:hypothetical protein